MLNEKIILEWIEMLVDVRLKLVLGNPTKSPGHLAIQSKVGHNESGPFKTSRLDLSNLSAGSNQHPHAREVKMKQAHPRTKQGKRAARQKK